MANLEFGDEAKSFYLTKIIKNKKIMIRFLVIIFLIFSVIGVKYYMDKPSTYEKQVAFLKEHEQEMTGYIKSQNAKIETVEYNWDSAEVETIGNGTPQGAGERLTIDGKFNNIPDSNFYIQFNIDTADKMPDIKNMSAYNSFRVGGTLYE